MTLAAAPAVAVAVNVAGARPLTVAVNEFAPATVPNVQPPTAASPDAFVVAVAAVVEPPPLATAKVTVTPLTRLLLASRTTTAGSVATAVPTVADWLFPAEIVTLAGAPAVAVAVNVAGARLLAVAVSEFAPATIPRVQLPTAATPNAFVVAVAPVIEPPPLATAKVTVTPITGLLLASRTSTAGDVETLAPTAADWPFPTEIVMLAAAPAVPVAVNVAGDRPPTVAVIVFGPAIVPSVQLPTTAIPDTFVVAVPPVTEPPPLATANVTVTPLTGRLLASRTTTVGGVATPVPTDVDWALPVTIATTAGAGAGVGPTTLSPPPPPPHEFARARPASANIHRWIGRTEVSPPLSVNRRLGWPDTQVPFVGRPAHKRHPISPRRKFAVEAVLGRYEHHPA